MKKFLIRTSIMLFALVGFIQTGSAQKEINEAKKITKNTKEYLDKTPSFSIMKLIPLNNEGNPLLNEDGTQKYEYRVIDKDGKVCDPDIAKKMTLSALNTGITLSFSLAETVKTLKAMIDGGKINALNILTATSLLTASTKLTADLTKQISLLKQYNKVIKAYKKTFTEEGTPLDLEANLSDVDGIDFTKCPELSKSAADIQDELAASVKYGETLEDIDLDDINLDDKQVYYPILKWDLSWKMVA